MKNLKIIEEGRNLKQAELNNVKGGYDLTCSGGARYVNCNLAALVSCAPSVAPGFTVLPNCNNDDSHLTCSSGYSFWSCSGSVFTSCGSGGTYSL
jgi:hypothetical protein